VVFIGDRLVDKENKVEVVLKRSIRTLFIISSSCKECCFQNGTFHVGGLQ
jgi:predicted Zn-ribbon and HTH transcriptional regulator